MKLGGRLQAAIEVLDDVLTRRTPVNMALRDWGKSHRFAGSKDRSAIGNYVHDALRKRLSLGWQMNDDSPRSLILGQASLVYSYDLIKAFKDDKHAPSDLSSNERKLVAGSISLDSAPDWVKADVPEWLWPAFSNNFDEEAIIEGQALAKRAPLDLRVNLLKTDVESAIKTLSVHQPISCNLSPIGLRLSADGPEARLPNIQIEEIYQTGGVDIQDEGSQIVSLLINAKPTDTILDLCAGGGGKSLALAGQIKGEGGIYAFDIDKRRLAPLYQRAQRAGADINVIQPPHENLNHLKNTIDRVVVDAPCSGVGTWRRKPDAKWRLSQDALGKRFKEQQTVLSQAKDFVRPGGYLFYITCSMLAEENEAQIYAFLEDNDNFNLLSAGEVWEEIFGTNGLKPWSTDGCSLTLTPASTQTDGFFFAVMEKGS